MYLLIIKSATRFKRKDSCFTKVKRKIWTDVCTPVDPTKVIYTPFHELDLSSRIIVAIFLFLFYLLYLL